MRFVHLSDLHIGKRVNDFSMIEDQRYILDEIINIIKESQVDAVFIAGDIYDKPVPSAEAVSLCDEFFTCLAALKKEIFIISGNHDSAERLSFASALLDKTGIHIAPVFDGKAFRYRMMDEYGVINIYLLPFVKPSIVRHFYPDEVIEDYTEAHDVIFKNMDINAGERNILLAHQFVTGAVTSDSEERNVGGLDNVDVSVFDRFDYVALGHIHGPQKIIRESVRYSGSILKYSFSEEHHKKSITIGEITDKGVTTKQHLLTPVREMRTIRGSYEEITRRDNYINTKLDDYVRIILTDEEEIPNVIGKLRSIYPNIMCIEYENTRTAYNNELSDIKPVKQTTPAEAFEEFYEFQNNKKMSDEQRAYVNTLIEEIWNETNIY